MIAVTEALQLALTAHQTGQRTQAEVIYREILKVTPSHADTLHLLGLFYLEEGRLDEAEPFIRQAIEHGTTVATFWNTLGNLHMDQSQAEEAIQAYETALSLDPEYAEAHANLGIALHATQQLEESLSHYDQALALEENVPEYWNNMGNVLRDLARSQDALAAYQKALAVDPNFLDALNNRCSLLQSLQQHEEALSHALQMIALNPGRAASFESLGSIYYKLGDFERAEAAYRQATALQPDLVKAHYNLGTMLSERKHFQASAESFLKGLTYEPENVDLNIGCGSSLYAQGDVERALVYFNKAADLQPDKAYWRWRAELTSPVIFPDNESIDAYLAQVDAVLDRHRAEKIHFPLDVLAQSDCQPSFYLSYLGRDVTPLKSKYADIFNEALQRDYPHLMAPPAASTDSRIRIAFMVSQTHEGVFLKLTRGFINHLPRDRFHVTLLCTQHSKNYVEPHIAHPDTHYLLLPDPGEAARLEETIQACKAQQFDILYYYEIGTDAWNYFLPFFNLARAQCTCYGLPISTGIPQIQHFISSALVESPTGQGFYREKMHLLATEPIYFDRPVLKTPMTRSELGLPEDKILFICPQNLFKFHPDFDAALGQILTRTPNSELVVIQGVFDTLTDPLRQRFQKTIPEAYGQIRFSRRFNYEEYLNLLALADVALDTFHYTGGTTSYETLSFATPLVTLPTEQTRGRQTYGNYNAMGMMDCVASSVEDYIDKAVRLGTDAEYRQQIQATIRERHHVLFNHTPTLVEMERCLWEIGQQARSQGGP
jgi:predicted O-linked N-acetylglucosamine transferase (SPINDLY family)